MTSAAAAHKPLSCDVLVVGGGFAGRTAARSAGAHGASVVLVDAKTYFEFTPSAPRCMVCPEAIDNSARSHEDPRQRVDPGRNVTTVHGLVERLGGEEASVRVLTRTVPVGKRDRASGADGGAGKAEMSVKFRYCIWAAGTGYQDPVHPRASSSSSITDRKAELVGYLEKMKTSRSVLVIGGGLVGVEVAAELAEIRRRYAERESLVAVPNITLASSGDRLLPRLPAAAGRIAEKFFSANGVERVRKRMQSADQSAGGVPRQGTFVSQDGSGLSVSADVVFDCRGPRGGPGGDALRKFAKSCNEQAVVPGRAGLVRVRNSLQLYGSETVFVAGDAGVVDNELLLEDDGGLGCEKTAYAAVEGGRLAAHNVTQLLRAGGSAASVVASQLGQFPDDAFGGAFPRMFAVGLGKWNGALCLGPLVLGGPVAAATKLVIEKMSVRAVSHGGVIDALWTATERLLYKLVRGFSAIGKWQNPLPFPPMRRARLPAR